MTRLADRRCRPDVVRLDDAAAQGLLAGLDGWSVEGGKLVKTFRFPDYHRTLAFVNLVAWIAHREDHHPELDVTYGRCRVAWDTHSVHGLSENDFICAARIDAQLG